MREDVSREKVCRERRCVERNRKRSRKEKTTEREINEDEKRHETWERRRSASLRQVMSSKATLDSQKPFALLQDHYCWRLWTM